MNSFCCAEHANAFSLANHSPGSVISVCRDFLTNVSVESDFWSGAQWSRIEMRQAKLARAHKTAAEIRARKSEMQVKKLDSAPS